MHSYLRTIGFSEISRKEWKNILNEVITAYDEKNVIEKDDQTVFAEMSKSFGNNIGIAVCGEYDEEDQFQMEYAFPYFRSTTVTNREDIFVERQAEKECYYGACEDVRLGASLIFYLANAGKYLKERYKENLANVSSALHLSALSVDGKILLSVQKDWNQIESAKQKREKRVQLFRRAQNGDEDAMESLTMSDMDTYAMVSRRIAEEDILSIVDTYFIPYGMECDRYYILGEIIGLEEVCNSYTGELLYQMNINCNDVEFELCINQKDLLGEPKVGRRFKGIVWTQGVLEFTNL